MEKFYVPVDKGETPVPSRVPTRQRSEILTLFGRAASQHPKTSRGGRGGDRRSLSTLLSSERAMVPFPQKSNHILTKKKENKARCVNVRASKEGAGKTARRKSVRMEVAGEKVPTEKSGHLRRTRGEKGSRKIDHLQPFHSKNKENQKKGKTD